MKDVLVVSRHELSSIFISQLSTSGVILLYGFILILFGVVVPLGYINAWLNSTIYLLLWFWLTWLIVAGPISDAFAGESERYTLQSLFASRLPTWSILAGKVLAIAAYGLVLSSLAHLVSYAVARALNAEWLGIGLQPVYFAIAAGSAPLAALMAVSTGSYVSICSHTARQAHTAIIIIAPTFIVLMLMFVRGVEWLSPVAFRSLSNCILPLSCSPLAITITGSVIVALSVAFYWLANRKLKRLRVIP